MMFLVVFFNISGIFYVLSKFTVTFVIKKKNELMFTNILNNLVTVLSNELETLKQHR